MTQPPSRPSKLAREIIDELIVIQGLSYVEAIRRARELADLAAAPYHEAAEVLFASMKESSNAGT